MVDKDEKGGGGLDPHQLLKALGSLLDAEGGAKGIPEILRIASLMKDAKKLVARCVYANILKNTKKEDVMSKYIEVGGWETLNIWLQDAKAVSNNEFIGELLDVYQNVPVSIELLKQNNCAKTIKQMSKAAAAKGDDNLSKRCADLVDRWMAAIKAEPMKDGSKQNSGDSSKKHKHHTSNEKKHKHSSSKSSDKSDEPSAKKEKSSSVDKSKSSSDGGSKSHRNRSESSSHKSHSSSSHSSKSQSKHSSDKDKSKSRHPSMDSRRDSNSSVTSQSSSSNQKSKSVMSSKDEKKTLSTGDNVFASVLSSADKNSDSSSTGGQKDSAQKAKTAKTAPTKFRSTGN